MRPERRWRLRLEDIVECVERIEHYVSELDLAGFQADTLVQDAVVRNLITIGEVVTHVPGELMAQAPEIPWQDIRGMRDLVVHAYWNQSIPIVWQAVTEDLIPLKASVLALLGRLPDEGDAT